MTDSGYALYRTQATLTLTRAKVPATNGGHTVSSQMRLPKGALVIEAGFAMHGHTVLNVQEDQLTSNLQAVTEYEFPASPSQIVKVSDLSDREYFLLRAGETIKFGDLSKALNLSGLEARPAPGSPRALDYIYEAAVNLRAIANRLNVRVEMDTVKADEQFIMGNTDTAIKVYPMSDAMKRERSRRAVDSLMKLSESQL